MAAAVDDDTWLEYHEQFGMSAVVGFARIAGVAVAMIAGFILLGSLAERLSRSGISVLTTAVTGMCLFIGVQLSLMAAPVAWAMPLWVLFGFFGTSGIIAYAALSQRFPVQLSGRVNTAVNLLVFVAAFVGQWAIGVIIGLWPVGDHGAYALEGYRTGFALMIGLQLFVHRTKLGKAMRAVAEDKDTSALMGIDVNQVIVFTFIISSALAGAEVAGALALALGSLSVTAITFIPGIGADGSVFSAVRLPAVRSWVASWVATTRTRVRCWAPWSVPRSVPPWRRRTRPTRC